MRASQLQLMGRWALGQFSHLSAEIAKQCQQVAEHKEEGAMETAPDAVEEFSHTSSPGPDMAAVSPLTPQVRNV